MSEDSTPTILPTTSDNLLQPDAMRGSEQYLKDLAQVRNLEQERRDKQEAAQNPDPNTPMTKSSTPTSSTSSTTTTSKSA